MLRNNPLMLIAVLLSMQCSLLAKSFTLQHSVSFFNGKTDLPAGTDTIFLATDTLTNSRGALKIKNLIGTAQSPLYITHLPGETFTLDADSFYYALTFENCHFIHLFGRLENGSYSLGVTGGTGTGIAFDEFCSDFTLESVEIYDVKGSGIKAKTYTFCGRKDTRTFPLDSIYPDPGGAYIMKNVRILNNYIHDTGEEGMYIGESFYPSKEETCGTLFSHEIHDLTVEGNRVHKTGWDGIQVGCATQGTSIKANEITNYGEAHHAWHGSGIQIGHGTDGACSENWIEYGFGHGIVMNGTGDNQVYNNVLLQIGMNFQAGDSCAPGNPALPGSVTCTDQAAHEAVGIYIAAPDSSFYNTTKTDGYWVYNNSLVGCKSGAIHYVLDSSVTVSSRINNNLIADYHFTHTDEFAIDVLETSGVNLCNNLVEKDKNELHWLASDYSTCDTCRGINVTTKPMLTSSSRAINSGTSFSGIASVDFQDSARTHDSRPDVGAFEYSDSTVLSIPIPDCPCDHVIVSGEGSFDGSVATAGDTICILSGYRSLLDIEDLQGDSSNSIVLIPHGGVVEFHHHNSELLEIARSSFVVLNGNVEDPERRGLDFKEVGSGTTTGVLALNTNELVVKGLTMYNLDTGFRYRFDQIDSTLSGERTLDLEDVSIVKGKHGVYLGYSSGFQGQEAWELSHIKADNLWVNSVDVGLILFGLNHEDTIEVVGSSFQHIEEYAIKAEQNSMVMVLQQNYFADIGYNALFSKSSYAQPFHFALENNVVIRSGNAAAVSDDKAVPLFVNFQQKQGSFKAYHNTVVGFEGDYAIRTKFANNTTSSVANNLILGENEYSGMINLNGNTATGNNYENNASTPDTAGFVAFSSDDLSLVQGSVWEDDGDTTIQVGVDYSGGDRIDSLPDIGAFEYRSTSKKESVVDNTEVVVNEVREGFLMYPNPAREEVNIELEADLEEWSYFLLDAAQRLVEEGDSNNKSATINIADLSKGIYFFKIMTQSGTSMVRQLVKN